ncbi:SCO1860 family LAETG-anchored protein [Streptomyces beijiangensis]|uniref:LPXTG cell wall anchor domain-containing protein n=1 Tax=Streptomyces beijiangensis TaxID=163361 RepID=A0A939JE70_9ACTN|nr:SCO1860 family LAETG-anchored protein [Streptomyces beijiangensis]MBO0512776.1 LPXTG cell wall anchor domain-containing protein [Streptomyces beijiangensis]
MNSNTFRMPARRRAAAALVAAALTTGPAVLLAAAPAHATDGGGKASAVVLRTGLDVSLLNKTVDVPLNVTLNDVRAPASAEKTALTVKLDSVDRNRPFSILRADVATAKATVDAHKAEGYVNLAHAKIHLPGLPLLSLVEVQQVTSKAVCEAGKRPYADSNLLGHVTVLGKKVTVSTGGTTRIAVPAVGEVTLDLSKTHTTSRTAAATALQLRVSVNPLNLNVAEVTGDITLAEAKCESPKAPATHEGGSTGGSGGGVKEQTAKDPVAVKTVAKEQNLAETGGNSMTPYIAGGALALVVAGGGALVLARGRNRR